MFVSLNLRNYKDYLDQYGTFCKFRVIAYLCSLQVQLMQRIKEEAKRAKTIELANMKKLAGLEKESRFCFY